jgi:hypothetical protein
MNNSCVINQKCVKVNNNVTLCDECQELYCNNHIEKCFNCKDKLCHKCIRRCNKCQEFYCKYCLILCSSKYCYGMYCEECDECENECMHNSDSDDN